MLKSLTPSSQKVQDTLIRLGYSYIVHESDVPTRTAKQAAEKVGCHLGQIVKSLIFRGELSGKSILVLTSGANFVDETLISNYANEPISRANPEFVRNVTGFAIGGVPPIAHTQPMETYIDEDLIKYETVWGAAGSPNSLFNLTSVDLIKMTNGQVVQIKQA